MLRCFHHIQSSWWTMDRFLHKPLSYLKKINNIQYQSDRSHEATHKIEPDNSAQSSSSCKSFPAEFRCPWIVSMILNINVITRWWYYYTTLTLYEVMWFPIRNIKNRCISDGMWWEKIKDHWIHMRFVDFCSSFHVCTY